MSETTKICAECGRPFRGSGRECLLCVPPVVSGVDGTMDKLVEAASIPNLGALIRGAKRKGLIKAIQNYGDSA